MPMEIIQGTRMTMQILDKSRYGEWDRFVSEGNGAIFHTSWWHKAWGIDFAIHVLLDENGEIEAGMPVYVSRFPGMPKVMDLLGIKGLTKPPLTPVNGPIFRACTRPGRPSVYSHAKKEIIQSLQSLPRLDFYDFHLWRFCTDLMPFMWNGFETQVLYTYLIKAGSAEIWHSNMSRKARRFLKDAGREAAREGYSDIITDAPFSDMDLPFRETMRRKKFEVAQYSGLPGWWETVRNRKAGKSYLIKDRNGKPVCASIMVWDNRTAYSLVGGMDSTIRRDSHINMLIFGRMIEDALEMGLDFDFEGSSLMGVERFYRGWGGELKPCFRAIKVPSKAAYFGFKAHKYLTLHRKKGWINPGETEGI